MRITCLVLSLLTATSGTCLTEADIGNHDDVFECPFFCLSDSEATRGPRLHAPSVSEKEKLCTGLGDDPAVKSSCIVVNDTADCRDDGWRNIPTSLPTGIRRLDLSQNQITAIQNRSLSRYPELERLDLGHNCISQLYSESFFGLSKLTYLNLRYNNLAYTKDTFPPRVFEPLKSLVQLWMSKNNPEPGMPELEYPSEELATLTSLEYLIMDGLREPVFDHHFQNMTSLRVLSLSGYVWGFCNISSLGEDTFKYLSQVKCLYLMTCFIQGANIHQKTFSPLKKLIFLDLTHNEQIGVEHLPKVSYGLQNTTTLRHLRFHLIVPRYSLGVCVTNESLRYFPQSVKYLDVQENAIESVGKGTVTLLPKGLQTLDLSGNKLVFGKAMMIALREFQNLQVLKLNGRTFVYNIPLQYPDYGSDTEIWDRNCSDHWRSYGNDSSFILQLPPNLKKIEMTTAGLIYHLTELHVDANNSLQILNLTGNRFEQLQGPLTGLNSLEHLDLSFCFVSDMKETFFQNLSSLQTLNLSSNYLGPLFSRIYSPFFAPLRNLKKLDLSFNVIEELGRDVLLGLDNLTHLYLARNLITAFECDISHMSNLTFLDLRRTHLAFLNKNTRDSVDRLLASGVHIRIDMAATPISCDCHNIDFLEWMVKSEAFNKSFAGYRCDYYDLLVQDIDDGYEQTMVLLRRKCHPQVYLLLVVSLAVTVVFVVVAVSICYRFRWNLRYLYHVAYMQYKKERKNSDKTRSPDFEYDVFLCYANEDEDFVVDVLEPEMRRRGLKVHVHGRDFVAGEYISSNIVGAVCRSRKTLVVLTPSMLKSSWCNYEIQMANMEAVHTGRKVLIFLLKGSVPMRHDNINVFYNIKMSTYLEYPSTGDAAAADQATMKAMWDKLARDISD